MIRLALPKFSCGSTLSLRATLDAIGAPDVFDPATADLSGVDGREDLYVKDVVHQANVSVDENGTTAAAAAAAIGEIVSRPELVTMTLHHPFLFFVQDDATHEILFLGRVADLSAG
jgi:serpin B